MEFLELLERKNIRLDIAGNTIFVYDDVKLSYCSIEKFPDCPMIFYGNVDLSYTLIKEFPKYFSITFCQNFNIGRTLTEEVSIDYITIKGNLNLSNSQLKELPDYTIIHGFLKINNTSITKIPRTLIAERIFVPVKGRVDMYIKKDGKIGIFWEGKSIKEWERFFKERRSSNISHFHLSSEDYNIIEQDFNNAVKLLESWNS